MKQVGLIISKRNEKKKKIDNQEIKEVGKKKAKWNKK